MGRTLSAYRLTLLIGLLLTFVSAGAQPIYSPLVKALPTRARMPVANVNSVIQDSEGYMWYATYEGGLCRDNGYQIDVFRQDKDHPNLLSDNVIYSLCEASDGQIWFSTAQSTYLLDKHDYSIRPLSDAFRSISALHIAQQPDGNMLVASDTLSYNVSTDGGILSQWHEKYRGRKVMVQPDEQGGYWICHTEKDLCYAQGDTTHIISQYPIAAKNILVDNQRQMLYAITQDGLQVFPISRERLGDCVYNYREVPELGIYGLYLDHQQNLWMTGYQPSFTIFTPQSANNIKRLNIASPQYDAVYVDYLCALGGNKLGVFKDIDYYAIYDMKDDTEILMSSDTVTPSHSWRTEQVLALIKKLTDIDTLLVKDATIDASGHLWIIFDQYVREINTSTGRYRDISVMGCDMGMNNFCCIAAVQDGVCVGGAGGACYLPSNPLLDDGQFDVRVSISSYDVTTDGTSSERFILSSIDQVPALSIDHDCTCLTLYLTSFNPINAQKIRFAVKVEGWDGDWVWLSPGENMFRLMNLPKGEYKIWLKATDENGLWGKEHEVLTIYRQPAWWESWWAYTCYLLLVLACLTGGFFLYRYVQQKREQFDKMLRLLNNPAIETHQEPEPATQGNEFKSKAIAAVRANMDDENYTVDMMAAELCMSRVNLYRKMMTLCGQTPSDFIKTLRMEEAYHLLTTTDLPINIIAGKCGFTSSSYFAKCFKARFQVLPGKVRGNSEK